MTKQQTAWRCERCKHQGEANVITVHELREQMYGRPPTLDRLECDVCPECGSDDYRLIHLCIECNAHEADEEGTDYCKTCCLIVEAREEAEFQEWKPRFQKDRKEGLWPA